jgi:hypothetical protein
MAGIWVAASVISFGAPDMVTGSEQQHFPVAAASTWLWGLVSTGAFALAMGKLRGNARADLDRSYRGDDHRLVGGDDREREPAARRNRDRSDANPDRRARRADGCDGAHGACRDHGERVLPPPEATSNP